MAGRRRFCGFISYSQRDKGDARRLQQVLESYRVPAGIAVGEVDERTRRLGRFFRDDDDMGAATDLGAALRGAIEDSENLIVVCSPNAAQSRWVNQEVLHFKRSGRGDRIFAVIVDGEPNASASEDEGRRRLECFPPALRFEIDETGALTGRPAEPLAVKVAGQSRARLRARLAAGLLRVPFDALWRRDRRAARAGLLRNAALALLVLVLVLAGTGAVLLFQARRAALERSQALVQAAQNAAKEGWYARSLRFAVLAAREGVIANAGPEAEVALAGAAKDSRRVAEIGEPRVHLAVAYSPDGHGLAAVDGEGRLDFWDAQSFALRLEVVVPGARLLAFSPDGRRLFSHAETNLIAIDPATGAIVASTPLSHRDVQAIVASPDGTRLAVSRYSDTTMLIDAASLAVVAELPGVTAAFAPDGSQLAVAAIEGSDIQFFNAATGAAERTTRFSHAGSVQSLAFSPNGRRLALQTNDGIGQIYNPATGDPIGPPLVPLENATGESLGSGEKIIFSPDMRIVAMSVGPVAGTWGAVRLWDAYSGRAIGPAIPLPARVTDFAFSPDGKRIVLAPLAMALHVYDAWSAALDGTAVPVSDSDAMVVEIGFTPDGKALVTLSDDSGVRLWDGHSGAPVQDIPGESTAVMIAGDSTIYTRSEGLLAQWRPGVKRPIRIIPLPGRYSAYLAASADGTRLAATTDDGVWLIDGATGRITARALPAAGMGNLSLTPDGMRLVIAGEQSVALLEPGNDLWLPLRTDADHNVALSPDGGMLATGSGPIRLWATGDGRKLRDLETGRPAQSIYNKREIAWSRDGARLAAAGAELHVWDAESGRPTGGTMSTEGLVMGLAFSADGSRILLDAAGFAFDYANGQIWDVGTGLPVGGRLFLSGSGGKLAVSPDGQLLAIADQHGAAHLFDIEFAATLHGQALIDAVCGRKLDGTERAVRKADGTPTGEIWSVRRIDDDDVAVVPALAGSLGRDVCVVPGFWEEMEDAFVSVFGG